MDNWWDDRFTGPFTEFGLLDLRPHDPDVYVCAATVPPWGARTDSMPAGGAGWDREPAQFAAIGEGVERMQPYALPCDQMIESSFKKWPRDEIAIDPGAWVLFHGEQYRQSGFPYAEFTPDTDCQWICCREAGSGQPVWIPSEFVFMYAPADRPHRIAPAISTGLSCSRWNGNALLRGLQECIERDAVICAWWGAYKIQEYDQNAILSALDPEIAPRILRPNLRYRFFRVDTPFSGHVTIVTLQGDDREGFCFSAGSACRETRCESWKKSILEAIHGRHYVRYLLRQDEVVARIKKNLPDDFSEHALYYSIHPGELERTVLRSPARGSDETDRGTESLRVLSERLGHERPILFRNITPPAIARENLDWLVLKVVVPGLTPLQGSHRFAHLGSNRWKPSGLGDWNRHPPHPFP